MPEGPSIVILKEQVQDFKNRKVLNVSGNSKLDLQRIQNKKIIEFKSWGKHFLICFKNFTIRIHFLLFGSYRINESKDSAPRLSIEFTNGELNFYACSVKFIEGDINAVYNWSADVMSDDWDEEAAVEKTKQEEKALVCDLLLNQNIFAGVGNIIKNEVLFRTKIHPESLTGKLPAEKLKELIKEARNFSFDFLEWKKNFELKKHYKAHTKKICPRCNIPFVKKHTGKTNRRSFYCESCQTKYD
jgi:endonuclease VIII